MWVGRYTPTYLGEWMEASRVILTYIVIEDSLGLMLKAKALKYSLL